MALGISKTVVNKTPDFMRQLVKRNAEALERACIFVQNQAQINVRKVTGFLRDSISYKVYDGSGSLPVSSPEKNSALVGTITVYAAYIEFVVEPFMRPAIVDNRENIMRLISDELRKVKVSVTGI